MKKMIVLMLFVSIISFGQLAVKGEKVFTMAGEVIENGIVIINDGKIIEVGKQAEISIPKGYEVIEGEYVTPGLIDVRTVVGLAGIYNQKHDQDQIEYSDPIQPELRAIDAFNPNEELIDWLAGFGVTTINTGHAPGALMSGQTMIVKTNGGTDLNILDSTFAVVFSLGNNVSGQFKTPGSRPKGIAMIRETFVKAQYYMTQRDEGKSEYNLKNEILSEVLSRKVKAIITANTTVDILGALRLAKEFKFDLIIDGAAESYLVLDHIKNAGVAVFVHPIMARTKNISYETPAILLKEGIPFAIQSGYESYVPKARNVLFEAAIAAANGLSFDQALASITIDAAKLLGVNQRVGSLEKGKDADIVVFDGDPFEYTSHVCEVIIDGKIIKSLCK